MAAMNAAAAKAAAALKATEAQKQMAQKAQLASANKLAELQKENAAMQVKQALGAAARGMTVGAAAPKPAPQFSANIPPAIRGAQGNDMVMSPRAGAATGIAAATPRPLAGQGNDMVMGSPATGGGIAPARPAAAVMKKKGGKIKAKSSYSSGGSVGSASKRADGCAQRGKTKGRMV